MVAIICKSLFLGILIVNELLPATARQVLPRSPTRGLRTASYIEPLLIPYKGARRPSQFENVPFRKTHKVYVITYNPESPGTKNLEILPLELNDDNDIYESKPVSPVTKNFDISALKKLFRKNVVLKRKSAFPVTKNVEMLPLEKLFDENGMLYLTKPKERKIKKLLQENDLVAKLKYILNEGLRTKEKTKQTDAPKLVYEFSDLVL